MNDEQSSQERCGYVAIVGRPNVGKSTLLNQLMARKMTITSKKAQTTRHNITCVLTDQDLRTQFLFVDTPGLNFDQSHRLKKWMNQQSLAAIRDLDCRIFVLEALVFDEKDEKIASFLAQYAETTLVLVNKIDKVKDKSSLLPYIKMLSDKGFKNIMPFCALKKDRITNLMQAVSPFLPHQEFFYSPEQQATCTKEFMSSEVIREKLLRYLGDEVPHLCVVQIDQLKIQKNNLCHIQATIYAQSLAHKKIIVGEHGASLKQIGTAARLSLENMFDQKVFLQLWVKIKDSWAAHVDVASEFGMMD